jgi:DNA-binding transcriptional MocR family regulator
MARADVDVESAAAQLLGDGIKIHTLDRYYVGPPTRTGLIFGYGAAEPAQLSLGIEKLCQALSSISAADAHPA